MVRPRSNHKRREGAPSSPRRTQVLGAESFQRADRHRTRVVGTGRCYAPPRWGTGDGSMATFAVVQTRRSDGQWRQRVLGTGQCTDWWLACDPRELTQTTFPTLLKRIGSARSEPSVGANVAESRGGLDRLGRTPGESKAPSTLHQRERCNACWTYTSSRSKRYGSRGNY